MADVPDAAVVADLDPCRVGAQHEERAQEDGHGLPQRRPPPDPLKQGEHGEAKRHGKRRGREVEVPRAARDHAGVEHSPLFAAQRVAHEARDEQGDGDGEVRYPWIEIWPGWSHLRLWKIYNGDQVTAITAVNATLSW